MLNIKEEEESKLAPSSARGGAFRIGDRFGRGEELQITDPSPLAIEIREKEEEKQRVLALSNPNSRPESKNDMRKMVGGGGGSKPTSRNKKKRNKV